MKKIILDTDIGIDCDDAAALALLLNYQKEGKCEILAITASTAREGAVSAIKCICEYYGATHIPVGRMSAPALECDKKNIYARALMERYGDREKVGDGVELIRSKLAKSEEKVTLISIGPLSNIAKLLLSEGDGYSPLTGEALVKEKVDCLYLMGGAFEENYDGVVVPKREIFAEWNIVQDIPSARIVAERFPCEMVYCPFEAGFRVYTYIGEADNPVGYSMVQFAEQAEGKIGGEGFRRMSWDPITCMVGVEGVIDFYTLSKNGRIAIDEKGVTTFSTNGKGHRYLRLKNNFEEISKYLHKKIWGKNL